MNQWKKLIIQFAEIWNMQERKSKLDYALSLYTKTGIHTSMLKCYSTAPFGFFTEIKMYQERQKFPFLYMLNFF